MVASGGEAYLIIGNFLPDSLTPHQVNSWMVPSFYFVDDVKLVQIPKPRPDGINELKVRFGVSPNPTSSLVLLNYDDSLRPETIELFTITGKAVLSEPWQRVLDVSDVSPGTYLLKVRFDNGAFGVDRLVISR